ncbi:unnamed protein product [Wickerhamomyces anomalus]
MSNSYEVYKEGGLLRGRYQKLEDISEGAFGLVSLAKDIKKAKLVAVKYIFKEEDIDPKKSRAPSKARSRGNAELNISKRLTEGVCEEAIYEINIQEKIGHHPNIISLLDYFDSFIILEYCSRGDLYEAIKADAGPSSTRDIVNVVLQLVDAVEFVHNKSIYHRDIKPENILIADDWTIRLTDWGLASTKRFCNDFGVGSERYMAPELFDEKNIDVYDASKCDIWSIGICFLNIVFHKNPFGSATHDDKSFSYFARNREALFDIFSTMSNDFFTALRYSLTLDPENRDLIQLKNEIKKIQSLTIDDDLANFSKQEEVHGYVGTEPIKIKNNAVGRKALGIPTPSSRINNNFTNYKKEFFNQQYHLIPPPSSPSQRRTRKSSSSSTGKYIPPNLRSPNTFKSPLQTSVTIDNLDLDDDLFVLEEADSPNSTFENEDMNGLDNAIAQMDLNDNYLSDSSSAPSLLVPMPLYGDRNKGSSLTVHNRSNMQSNELLKPKVAPKSSNSNSSDENNGQKKYVPPHHRADYPQWAATHKKADSFHHNNHNHNNGRFRFITNQRKAELMSSSVPTRAKSDWFNNGSKIDEFDDDFLIDDDDFEKTEMFHAYAQRVGEQVFNHDGFSSNGSSKMKNRHVRESTRELTSAIAD